ncbi:MAG: phosphate signaling complex protein PhoU [Burkholderiaceae bacterium]|jgi:phosphate transport system protein|nr:phosphate signaling complex protein PhoU [Betaproteobacteria bacterium]MDA9076080.1 phosphate signaling complex protein PhoU [Burkholderiaceae bacterium]MCH9847313.1 phosphate signaling complex protein PhoU [Betaproteobacteria bacterium]MDA9884501.1 phosphate signaling complex protein PhoU [Burkholderiaceae bacterium]MDC1457641.1 phosphate signaling complex protein PhoU [Burkholderiaceae bacterium]|tara:strand:- start:3128 stop:3829 length:702 start_codon:yes stop_codon:yes gene_type:complete
MSGKHISSQFDSELNAISTRVMEMGGVVELQLRTAIAALSDMDVEAADNVIELETEVNNFELELDHDISSIIGRRQPTARDLRLLMAMARTTGNLERAGDEVTKMARMVHSIIQSGEARSLPTSELRSASEMAVNLLRKSLDAIARLDVHMALTIIKEDDLIDQEYNGFLRKLMTYIMEDPRTISASLNLLFLAKAIERVGDHAKNIAESTIYVVKGEDVRHASLESVESLVK